MTTVLVPASTGEMLSSTERLRVAVAAFLARYTGLSRAHTASDLRGFLDWCADRGVDPLAASRPQLELFVRWMQETRQLKPSTLSRRTSVVAGFYRTCVIDGVLERPPAEHLRRPRVPPESPTLGLTHLQFKALLTAARDSGKRNDFALVAMLGLLGLRVFEACGSDVADLGEEHGHRVLRVVGKGSKVVLVPLPPAVGRAIDLAVDERPGRADPAHPPRVADGPARRHPTPAPAGRGVRDADAAAAPAHAPGHVRHHDARRRGGPVGRADRRPPRRTRTTMRYDRARKNLDRHPNYVLAAFMASGT